jgi:hypothetical protein
VAQRGGSLRANFVLRQIKALEEDLAFLNGERYSNGAFVANVVAG